MEATLRPLLSSLTSMLYDMEVWGAGLILLSPALVLGIAWARSRQFYSSKPIRRHQKLLYLVALGAASVSTLAYLGYWGCRVCGLYQVTLPFTALLALEGFLYASRLLSAIAIVGLFIGRGPHRVLVTLATLWVMLQLWTHDGIIHRA